jgi:hypothetical protein
MSHHFDYPTDETLDITDAYCFAGAGDILEDILAPHMVFGMNTSPLKGQLRNPAGYCELKIDTNRDYVEDITFRATFRRRRRHAARASGAAHRPHCHRPHCHRPPCHRPHCLGHDHHASQAPVGEVVECRHGIKLFAGQRLDPFCNFIPFPVATTKALAGGTFPDYDALRPASDSFANTTVRSFVLEVPVKITGRCPVNYWASTAYFDTGHKTWVQVQRAVEPDMTTFFDFALGSAQVANYTGTAPTIDLVGTAALATFAAAG